MEKKQILNQAAPNLRPDITLKLVTQKQRGGGRESNGLQLRLWDCLFIKHILSVKIRSREWPLQWVGELIQGSKHQMLMKCHQTMSGYHDEIILQCSPTLHNTKFHPPPCPRPFWLLWSQQLQSFCNAPRTWGQCGSARHCPEIFILLCRDHIT